MEKRRGPRMQFPDSRRHRLEYIAFLLPCHRQFKASQAAQDPVSLHIPSAFADSNVRGH